MFPTWACSKIAMERLETYIKNNLPVSPSDLAVISKCFVPAILDKGEYFVRQGRYCDRLAFINTGYIRVFIEADNREVTQWISTPGYFITDVTSFVFQTPARWNMQALSECQLLSIDRASYNKLRSELPVWRELDRMFIARCFTLMEERIFNHLHMDSETRFDALMKTQPELFNIVPLQYLASMLGMTPENLSRLRRKSSQT